MKTVTLIFLTIGLLTLNSCNQKTDVNTMLENSETRSGIFDAITNNHEYMTELMTNMHNSEHAMEMMQGEGMQMMMKDSMMMKNMMGNKQMMQAMMKDMMGDGKMMGNMMKMMHEKGMMSEDCMESCMKMMADKGMDMGKMDMMNKTDGTTEEDHTEHH